MNPIPESRGNRSNPGLVGVNVAVQPSNAYPYLPEITHQILLDTSDSESERFEPATSKSRAGNDRDQSTFSKSPRISPHGPSHQSPVVRSRTESVRSGSNSFSGSSNSKVPGPGNNLRFIPSPHPDMIQRISSGLESSKSDSAAESSSSRRNPGLSHSSGSHRFESTCNVNVASVTESVGPSGNFVASSLTKSRFTSKTSSSMSDNTEKRLDSASMDVDAKIERNLGCSKQMVSRQLIDVPSRPVMMDHAIFRRFEGRIVNVPSEPVLSGFNEEIPIRVSRGVRNSPSSSQMEPLTAKLNYVAVASSSGQKPSLNPAVSLQSEPVTSKCYKGISGNSRNSPPSFHTSMHSMICAGGASSRCQNPSSQLSIARQATNIKLEPAEFDPRGVGSSQNKSAVLRNVSSSQMPGQAPVLDFTDSISYVHPLNSQTVLHRTSNLRPEQVGFDHVVPGCSASGSDNPRNIPSSSLSLATRQTFISSASIDHSSRSYLGTNVGSGSKGSSGSTSIVTPSRSNMDANPQNSNSASYQERQITSESLDSGVVVMSVVHKKNKVAGSSYNLSTGQVHLLESVTENFEFCTTVLALRSVTPSVVVLPSSGATRFVKELKAKIEGDQTLKDCQFQCLSPRYFAYSFARRTVLESSLWEGCITFRSQDAKKNAIVSNINLNDERLVCAFGGLLYHLSTGCPQLGAAGMSPCPITSIQHMKLSNKLWLDTESFKNLQIFDPGEHPSSFKWSSASRDDGKSIFGLFERYCSTVGMTKLKSFLANPFNCRTVLEKRHEVMNFFLNHSNYNAVEALRSFTSQMSSSSVILSYLSSPTLRGGHWKHIYRHIYYTVSYAEVCRSHDDQSELFRELGSTIVDAVYSMAHNLERVVDLVNMENNETFVIKYGFHPPLDAAKEKFSRLKMAMDKVTPYEFDSVPSFITRIQMMYIPEMKFLLSIPYWAQDLSKEELNLPNLEFKFTANKTAFYKSRRCYELDELLGDAQTDIINEESMIIQSLRNYLKKHMHHIVGMAQKIAEIECIFALAKVAREERYSKPEIVDSYVIDIRGGWHPLLDVPSNELITNDLVSSADTSLVKLIYGPNASGKSIYLKQVGLLMYLVHVGSYVPAGSARVGLFGRILARTRTEESVISMSSTMLTELKKLQDASMGCAKDTLVIMDEVGKGSTEVNCVAIVTSAVNYFLSQGSDCPHVLISTHLSGITDFVTSPPHSDGCRNLFKLLIMDYTVTEGEIVFLYKILEGSPSVSFVFEVLENSEFAAPIVKTAKTVLEALRTGENFLPYCETRIQRSHKYLNFIRKFVNIDMAKPGYLEKLQNKIQRYYEKPSY